MKQARVDLANKLLYFWIPIGYIGIVLLYSSRYQGTSVAEERGYGVIIAIGCAIFWMYWLREITAFAAWRDLKNSYLALQKLVIESIDIETPLDMSHVASIIAHNLEVESKKKFYKAGLICNYEFEKLIINMRFVPEEDCEF